ncbi:MAG: hypothetical protein ACRDT1_16660, partial [Micromonosporaceae bacterium]
GAGLPPDTALSAARALGENPLAWSGPGCGLVGVSTAPVEAGSAAAVAIGDVDPAAVLKAYAEQGLSALLGLGGDYAVAVADPDSGTLALACGGDLTLYHTALPSGGRHVASRPAALLAVGAAAEPDPEALRRFVETGDSGSTSCFAGIQRVRPGEAVLISGDGVTNRELTPGARSDNPVATPPADPSTAAAATTAAEDLSVVAALAENLTRDMWRFVRDLGVPPADVSRYVRWAASHRDPAAAATASETAATAAPTQQLLLRLKNRIYGAFLSDTFATRPWVDANEAITGFEALIKGNDVDAERYWRLYLTEQWARIVLEGEPEPVETPPKGPFEPNRDKQLAITVDGQEWLRYPIRTKLFAKGDDLKLSIGQYVNDLVAASEAEPDQRELFDRPWYLVISEKIVAIAQGRSYFIWEIKPNWWARTLSRYVVRTPYGIGLGSPWTMQLALQEVGLPRILFASGVSLIGKALGRRGWFYRVAGSAVRAIDGPTEYSAYPANVSAKLAPAKPATVSAEITESLRDTLRAPAKDTLRGVVV